jgi:serine/threonine-protein phosphatase 2A regulatory subunit B''
MECAVFDEHVRRSRLGRGHPREMDVASFVDFVLAMDYKNTPEALGYLFRCLDIRGQGFLTAADIYTLFK